jgi:hypothetical protein
MATIVERLSSESGEERSKAVTELQGLANLTVEESVNALYAASAIFLPLTEGWLDASEELVSAAAQEPIPEHIPVIREHFRLYSPRAQGAAIGLVATLESRAATETFTFLLDDVSEEAQVTTLGTMTEKPRHADVLFPEVLRHVRHPALRGPLSSLILAHLTSGTVTGTSIQPEISSAMIGLHDELRAQLSPLQKSEGRDWMWDEQYQEPRFIAALVLDIFGHITTPEAERGLVEALDYQDPRLRMFAVLGLLSHGKEPPHESLFEIAKSAETRNWVYRGLAELDRLDLLPAEYTTQKAFAEAEMVDWLTYPTELARAPDEIELMAVVPETCEEGAGETYVFRFRTLPPHWAAKEGWMAGVAGPFLLSESPSPDARGGTFSTFTSWKEHSPEEHLRTIRETRARAHEP